MLRSPPHLATVRDIDRLEHSFRHFARMCEGLSPLYVELSPRVAGDPRVLSLVEHRQPKQSPVNLLFGAVHDLLLAGAEHELAAHYPSVGGVRSCEGAYPLFADFCRRFEPSIVERIRTRRVQTNEVGRCGLLLPALAIAWERSGRRPLHLIEIGASAGLNLLPDRYRYAYHAPGSDRPRALGPPSPACVRTTLRTEGLPLPATVPPIAGRVGVDIDPVDVADVEAMRWVEAMIWPDQLHRIELFRAAVAIARDAPPPLIRGDGLEHVGGLVESVPAASLPVVFHTYAAYQMTADWRGRFADELGRLGDARDIARVSIEWLGDDPGPQLHLTTWRDGRARREHLASCDNHGAWLEGTQ